MVVKNSPEAKKGSFLLEENMGKIYFILGGVRSGKSNFALKLAEEMSGDNVIYLATGIPLDEEMKERILEHQRRRREKWETREVQLELEEALKYGQIKQETIIIDCLTFWVFNLYEQYKKNNNGDIKSLIKIGDLIIKKTEELCELLKEFDFDTIVVSNEVGLGVIPPFLDGRIYRDILGKVNQAVARFADEVFFLTAGIVQKIK